MEYCCKPIEAFFQLIQASEIELSKAKKLYFEGYTQDTKYYMNFDYCPCCGKSFAGKKSIKDLIEIKNELHLENNRLTKKWNQERALIKDLYTKIQELEEKVSMQKTIDRKFANLNP